MTDQNQTDDPGNQDRERQQQVDRQQNQQGNDAEKTRTLADRAGGGSNKGSFMGSNEGIDQADRNSDAAQDE